MKFDTNFSIGDKVWVTDYNNKKPIKVTVGQVNVSLTDSPGIEGETLFDNYKAQYKYEESYMIIETGIGTGTIYNNVFATRKECETFIESKLKEKKGKQ